MHGIIIFMSCMSVLPISSSNVKFLYEPMDSCIPWLGHIQLNCKVDHPKAIYSWLAIHHAPVDLIFSNGCLHYLREPTALFERTEAVVENSSFVNVNFGSLLLKHPSSVDKVSKSKALKLNHKSWLEGSYRCKASIPGQGSLVSRTAHIRLSDLFLEPNLPTTYILPSNSHESITPEFRQHSNQGTSPLSLPSMVDANKHPGLGGGNFYPGEVVVLRCPIITVSSTKPIIRWFHVTSDVMVMQPVGFSTDPNHPPWSNSYEAVTLDGGRWLEIHLGYLNTTVTSAATSINHLGGGSNDKPGDQFKWNDEDYAYPTHTGKKSYPNEQYFRAGFGEYFCEVHIPSMQVGDTNNNLSDEVGLNGTGPYIPVTPFRLSSSSSSSSLKTSATVSAVYNLHDPDSKDAVVWSVQPYELVQIDLPSLFIHSLSTTLQSELQSHLFVSRQHELWRRVNSSVTLLCAGNIRQYAGSQGDCNLNSLKTLQFNDLRRLKTGYGIQWTKDGETLSDKFFQASQSRFHQVGSGSFMINNIQLNDTGVYTCQVINFRLNTVLNETSVKLVVGSSPVLLNASLTDIQVKLHFEQVLWCSFETNYPTVVQWRKNGEIIQDSEYFRIINNYAQFGQFIHQQEPEQQLMMVMVTQLSIQRILPNDSGYFQCLAENRFGSIQHSIHLHVMQGNSNDYVNDGIDSSRDSNMLMMIPANVRALNVSDTHAYLMWDEPQWSSLSSNSLMYLIRIESDRSPGHLILNTTKSAILLADLQPETVYTMRIYPASKVDPNRRWNNSASIRFITKPPIRRPLAVKDIAAESWKFGTLTISWKAPSSDGSDSSSTETIISYQIILRPLVSEPSDIDDAISRKEIKVNVHVNKLTSNADRLSYTVLNLTPDAFYQIIVYPISETNVTGRLAYLASSSRVVSRPPSKSPVNVQVNSVGAHVATISWQPPSMKYRNGQIIVYRINISCEDWLRPRYIMVQNKLTQLIQGLVSGMKYDLSVSAATRAGNGPESDIITFTTFTQKNKADTNAESSGDGYMLPSDISEDFGIPFTQSPSASGSRQITLSLGPVENLQWLPDERSLLVLWSPPIISYSFGIPRTHGDSSSTSRDSDISSRSKTVGTDISHYIIAWGKMHPGPDSVELPRNQTQYLIDKLEPDTAYFIKVVVVGESQETKEAFISARTKPASSNERLLIPLNLHVSSSDSDWAILKWDKPECVHQQMQNNNDRMVGGSGSGQLHQHQQLIAKASDSSLDCSPNNNNDNNRALIKFYQVAYQMIGYAPNRTEMKTKNDQTTAGDDNGLQLSPSSSVSLSGDSQQGDFALDKTQHVINVTDNWARLENLQYGRLYSAVVRAVGEKAFEEAHFNSHRGSSNMLFSEWSLEQIIETPERKPGDSPRDISLLGPSVGSGGQPVSIRISWQPPKHPNGLLTGYVLYYSTNHSLPLSEWSRRRLPPDSLNTVISGLARNAVYAFRLKATNPFGDGPMSPGKFYRTPDVYGQGGGVLTFTDLEYIHADSGVSSISLHDMNDNHKFSNNHPADLTFVKMASNVDKYSSGTIDSSSSSSTSTGTINVGKISSGRMANSWLITGAMVGLLVMIVVVTIISLVWRKHRRNFGQFIGYKLEQSVGHVSGEGSVMDNNADHSSKSNNNKKNKNANNASHQFFGKKNKRLGKSLGGAGHQDVALLVSNGEAILASDIQQPLSNSLLTSGVLVTMPTMLTTSVNLSATAATVAGGPIPSAGVTPSQGVLYNKQNNMNAGSYSWDHDSDSLQFASVSQERTIGGGDSTQSPGHGQNTPTNAGSRGSTNSARDSIGTPTRLVPANLAYHQVLGFPNDAALGYAYPAVSLVPSNMMMSPMVVGSDAATVPLPNNNSNIPITGYPDHLVVSSAVLVTGNVANNINDSNYMVQYHPATSVFNYANQIPMDRLPPPVVATQMVYTGQSSARFPNAMPYSNDPSQMVTYAHVINPSYTGQPSFVTVNTPRVNAAEIMSFTSSDIGPVMSNSANENDSQKFISMNGDDRSRVKLYNQTHTTPKSKRITSSGNTGPRSVTSPRRRPLPNSIHNEQNTDIHSRRSTINQQNAIGNNNTTNTTCSGHYNNNGSSSSSSSKNNNTKRFVKQDCSRNSMVMNHDESETELEGVQKAFSSEELSQEMANLEGLMKDLSAIAQEEFSC
ncbi:unnamed protein product [Heterobilharzia americana]|nr:unnamed protein product [Heterobilharzia americana]